jgi:hypothetical protein
LEVFLRIDELSFVFVVVSRLAHRVTLILAVTSVCFLNLAARASLLETHALDLGRRLEPMTRKKKAPPHRTRGAH